MPTSVTTNLFNEKSANDVEHKVFGQVDEHGCGIVARPAENEKTGKSASCSSRERHSDFPVLRNPPPLVMLLGLCLPDINNLLLKPFGKLCQTRTP